MMSSPISLSCERALSRVVLLMTRPSGSFHDAFLLEPWCLIRIWDALTWFPDEDILVFLVLLKEALSLFFRSTDEIDEASFFLLRSEDSIFAEKKETTNEISEYRREKWFKDFLFSIWDLLLSFFIFTNDLPFSFSLFTLITFLPPLFLCLFVFFIDKLHQKF